MPIRVGPLAFCAMAGFSRAVWLSAQLSGFHAADVGFLLFADVPVLGCLGLLAVAESRLGPPASLLALLSTALLVLVYVADVLAVVALNSRLQVNDLIRFAVDWWVIPSYVNAWSLSFLAVLVASFFATVRVSGLTIRNVGIVSAGLLLFVPLRASLPVPSHLEKYTGSVFLLSKEIWGSRRPPVSEYRQGDFSAYADEYAASFDAPFAKTRRNVILLIVESLSSADSYRTSGLRNVLPRFDDLSREGLLFRNFFANYEASEGGIVALLSGVPPLHFPTATTDTFGEYAGQRSIVRSFARSGYRCEFLTSVPIDFISMDTYARSPSIGFSRAAGQKEIARFQGAPRYGFESPTDRLLYEEVLARLDLRGKGTQPALLVAVTASSHPPYVDPLGRRNTASNVWSYVQEEFWWLYRELQARRFFENGLLVITADHRKMVPIAEHERARYGESAKARIPLLIIGAGIPKGVLDDRLFQQSDLLRMLDRVGAPAAPLSPFALWAERYMFAFGVASNASNVQVFEPADLGRRGYRLNLNGAEIEWLDRPDDALLVERSIHRQRALQQAERQARVGQMALRFGRELRPAADSYGLLAGLSTDLDLTRDPDDSRGGLRLFTTGSLNPSDLRRQSGTSAVSYTLSARGFLKVDREGPYWFSVFANRASCMAIDKKIVLECRLGVNEGVAFLTAGLHRFDLRYLGVGPDQALQIRWLPPGEKRFVEVPAGLLLQPQM